MSKVMTGLWSFPALLLQQSSTKLIKGWNFKNFVHSGVNE